MGITTGGIGKIQVQQTSVSGTNKDEQPADLFATIMDMSSKASAPYQAEMNTTKQTCKSKTNLYEEQNTMDSYKIDSYDKFTDVPEETEGSTDVDVLSDKIKEVISAIENILADKLGISEEELEDALETFGFVISDFADTDKLQSFILQFEGASEVDLLIRGELSEMVSDLTKQIQVVINEAHLMNEDIANAEIPVYFEDEKEDLEAKADNQNTIPVSENDLMKTKFADKKEISTNVDDSLIKIDVDADVLNETQIGSESTQKDFSDTNKDSIATALNQSVEQAFTSDSVEAVNFSAGIQQADILRQVVEAVRVNISRNQTSMTLQLNPENLGKVQISVVQRHGMMQAQIVAENEAAKQAIEGNLAMLHEAFHHQELRVESVEVTVASYEFFDQQDAKYDDNSDGQTNNRSGSQRNVTILDDSNGDREEIEEALMHTVGNRVNYQI
ncbi:MAG: flagellar hook-length control protein FliK [Lachnospiraceae bacterium]|nr:flagellar hook-length control protein FliK [Lachnospiraceae bacterium]